MTAYADASLIVAAFTTEPASEMSAQWLTGLAPGDLMTSHWCDTEIVSALAIKTRMGLLKPRDGDIVFNAIRATLAAAATAIPVDPRHFEAATDLIRRSGKPLRAGDALHLAIARAGGATLWTLDRRMAEAGQALGLATMLLS